MSIPTNETREPIFCERQPDWSREVSAFASHSTSVFESRQGMEQRLRMRARARWKIQYTESGLDVEGQRLRQARAMAEVAYPVYVPWWTLAGNAATIVGAVVTLDYDPVPGFWEVGHKVYTGGLFYDVESVTGREITLSDAPAVLAGAYVYPVRLCRRVMGEDKLQPSGNVLTSWEESLIFETID